MMWMMKIQNDIGRVNTNCRHHLLLMAKLVVEVLQTIFVEITFAYG
jgi:hypothetical protein